MFWVDTSAKRRVPWPLKLNATEGRLFSSWLPLALVSISPVTTERFFST